MLYFIINPSSSSGNGLKIWGKCDAILKQKNVEYRPFFLHGPNDAGKIAKEISGMTPCTVVIVGGDGTINEFLTGLDSFEGITFACLPTGSANDFVRGMDLAGKTEDLLERILDSSHIRMLDIGTASSESAQRSFAVSSGMGFDAAVCYASQEGSGTFKRLLNRLHLGKLIYLLNALRMLFSMKLFDMEVHIDEGETLAYSRVCFAAAMNTRFEGGGFMFAPQADPSDGCLDLIIAENIPKWKILMILPTAFSGKHLRYKGIHLIRCKSAELSSRSDQCVHTDGEHLGFCRRVRFSIRDEKLRIIS